MENGARPGHDLWLPRKTHKTRGYLCHTLTHTHVDVHVHAHMFVSHMHDKYTITHIERGVCCLRLIDKEHTHMHKDAHTHRSLSDKYTDKGTHTNTEGKEDSSQSGVRQP